ncbi:MAG: ComEC/Rec2 family competence protein [Planctomycetota bacterium]|jgi:ComEC/Rec2-related protein|nr:ComEC/Rec2 family competence protein [Planctomycetota bacterium]
MLASRPMFCFALAVMAGAVSARLWPGLSDWLIAGWLAAGALAICFFLAPGLGAAPPPAVLPAGYGRHILPRPGFFARRGLNRLILVASLFFFLLGGERQTAWRLEAEAALGKLPGQTWFNASFLALGPSRIRPGETGVWRAPVLLVETGGGESVNLPARLSGPAGLAFRRGDLILARVWREPPGQPAYPGAFNPSLWLERDGIFASFGVARPREAGQRRHFQVIRIDDPPAATRLRRHIDELRGWAIERTLASGGAHGNLLAAMLYGYRGNLDAGLRDSFRRVGIGHVLAISGLHVGLVVGLLWWVSGWLALSGRSRAGGCLLLSLLYLGMAGGQVAAVRATLMVCLHFLGVIAGRRGERLNSLGAAALFLTLHNPSSPMDVSFQLSFTAMVFLYAGLGYGAGRDGETPRPIAFPSWRSRLAREGAALLRLSVATWLGLFPIVALVFNQINLAGLPINVFVIPLMSLVLAGGLLLPWLGWLPGAAWLLTLPTGVLVEIALWIDRLPGSSFPCHAPGGGQVFLFYLAAGLVLIPGTGGSGNFRRRWRRLSFIPLALSLAALLASLRSEGPPAGGRIAVLPGRGFGSLVVESEAGGVAALGGIGRSGLDEAGWLHSLRRNGRVGVVAIGSARAGRLSSLDWHFGVGDETNLKTTDPVQTWRSFGWAPVPGAPGVEYAFRRDFQGRLIWLAARTGGKSVCLAPRLTANWAERLRLDAGKLGFRLLVLGFAPGAWQSLPDSAFAVPIASLGWTIPASRPNWFSRRAYGVIRLGDDGLSGFADGVWRRIVGP